MVDMYFINYFLINESTAIATKLSAAYISLPVMKYTNPEITTAGRKKSSAFVIMIIMMPIRKRTATPIKVSIPIAKTENILFGKAIPSS